MIETPNRAAHIGIIEETIGPIGRLWSLSIWNKQNLVFIYTTTVLQYAIRMTTITFIVNRWITYHMIRYEYNTELINFSWKLGDD